ncbi:hypothetical protein G6F24_017901 [Rhizopus arrhizus]|nr:hypothetical protein G6F24_017901 [Rhizopus arrhizus]
MKTAWWASRKRRWRPPAARAGSKPRAGAFTRAAGSSGAASSSTRFTMTMATCLALPRSPATSPSNGRHSACCAMPSVHCATPSSSRRSAGSAVACRTSSTTC